MIAPMNESGPQLNAEIETVERWVRVGDYRQARRAVKKLLAESSLTDAERKRLDTLWDSMAVDRGALVAFGLTGLVLLFLLLKYGI